MKLNLFMRVCVFFFFKKPLKDFPFYYLMLLLLLLRQEWNGIRYAEETGNF